jgi:hypothetical protein
MCASVRLLQYLAARILIFTLKLNDMRKQRLLRPITAIALWTVTASTVAFAEEFRIEHKADWDTWSFPRSVVAQQDDGSIGLQRVGKAINAVTDARQFRHIVKSSREPIPGGVRFAFSAAESVENVIDGRTDTWWQPDPEDPIEDWWFEVDLGRMVYATEIRLIFPDTTDAEPFRNFSVYISNGERYNAAKDIFSFYRAGRTIRPNEGRVVEFSLQTIDPGGGTGEHLSLSDTLRFAPVQYIRFIAEEHQPGAALAEIEVTAIGENLALGSIDRGGSIRVGTDVQNSASFSDGDHNTKWTVTGLNSWIEEGHYLAWDLGAAYWLDRMVIEVSVPGHRTLYVEDFEISTSDGTPVDGLTIDRVQSEFDYQLLTQVDATASPVQHWFDLSFPLRKTRHIFFHRVNFSNIRVWYTMLEYAVYGEGYAAEAEMTSGYIDLGRAKSIRTLTWDADLPEGTYMEIRSQTGDSFVVEKKYFRKSGEEVSEAQWNKLPKSQKLDVVEIQRRGTDWSGWSPVYTTPEGVFQSPSPRRYAQLQVKLGNYDPEVTPLLRNIALQFDAALISGGVTSQIFPRQAAFDSLQVFTYTLKPVFHSGDQGFDRVLIQTPDEVDEVSLKVGGEAVLPLAVAMRGDSLQVDLPQRVLRDSVELTFQARIQANATTFDAWVSQVGQDLRQGVRAQQWQAATVFVPSVASGSDLIRLVEVTRLVTPNGDGVNDVAMIRFSLAKVESSEPEVSVCDLSGRRVRTIAASPDGYAWDGHDDQGRLLPPGTYICQIRLSVDAGEQTALRVIGLAY